MLLISLYPWMLSLTPPTLHSLHSIFSGGALGLFRLDVCMCQQGGEFFGEVIEQGGDLFDFWKTCCAQVFESAFVVHRYLRVHHFGRVALVRGKNFVWGVSALVWLLVSSFSLCILHDCVECYLCLWRVMFLAFDRLRRAVALLLGNRSLLE